MNLIWKLGFINENNMKNAILKVAENLENDSIDSEKARILLLNLFGVNGAFQPLTVDNVNKMIKKASHEAWIAAKGNDIGFKEWYLQKCKVNVNKITS